MIYSIALMAWLLLLALAALARSRRRWLRAAGLAALQDSRERAWPRWKPSSSSARN